MRNAWQVCSLWKAAAGDSSPLGPDLWVCVPMDDTVIKGPSINHTEKVGDGAGMGCTVAGKQSDTGLDNVGQPSWTSWGWTNPGLATPPLPGRTPLHPLCTAVSCSAVEVALELLGLGFRVCDAQRVQLVPRRLILIDK